MNKRELILIGGGGHCVSCIDVIEQENIFKIAGIVDLKERIGEKILSYPVVATDGDLESLSKSYEFFLITLGQLGSGERRTALYNILIELKVSIPTIVSPYAYLSKHATVGKGTILMHQSLVNANAKIGDNCIINTKALVEHDAIIGSHCHISTGAVVNGGVTVGENTFYGSGAVSKEGIIIPAKSFIKANSVVK
ncbi:MAG TPA: NeuD/PglB/VioB family sugar acetyltransferase [Bacteroidia bacterium]|nr:NeuD/PglB/VioB family sugar acetyltransferase [Bacteroidia bacterium]